MWGIGTDRKRGDEANLMYWIHRVCWSFSSSSRCISASKYKTWPYFWFRRYYLYIATFLPTLSNKQIQKGHGAILTALPLASDGDIVDGELTQWLRVQCYTMTMRTNVSGFRYSVLFWHAWAPMTMRCDDTQFVYNLEHKSKCYCCKGVIIISMT